MRSIVPLILKWEEFCEGLDGSVSQESSLTIFATWLLSGKKLNEKADSENGEDMKRFFKEVNPEFLSSFSGYLIARLFKFAKLYTRDILAAHGLSSIEEFGILSHLQKEGHANASVIAERLMNEYTTTVEMVNRLAKQGLIERFADEEDKRTKKLRLTEKGKTLIFSLFQGFKNTQDLLIGLDDWEKLLLVKLLEKLEFEHNQLNASKK